MDILTRSSPWRQLFDPRRALPDADVQLVAPLRDVFDHYPADLQASSVTQWQRQLVRALLALDLPAWRISQLISDHNDWIYHQVITRLLAEMRASGWGEPPVEFCVLQLGSAARHESLLCPDQDNAMILADYPDAMHRSVDSWFQHFSWEMNQRLAQAGIPLCNGRVMACWPLWRKRLSEWVTQMQIWTQGRVVKRVQNSNILLDFYPVYGATHLAEKFHLALQDLWPRAGGFLDEMASLLDEIPLALDRFDRLVGDGREAPHENALNLKRQGLLPLQSATRLAAILAQAQGVSTEERLQALRLSGRIHRDQCQDLIDSLRFLQSLLLEWQMQSLEAGRQADYWVDRSALSEGQTRQLKNTLELIRRWVKQVQKDVQAGAS